VGINTNYIVGITRLHIVHTQGKYRVGINTNYIVGIAHKLHYWKYTQITQWEVDTGLHTVHTAQG